MVTIEHVEDTVDYVGADNAISKILDL